MQNKHHISQKDKAYMLLALKLAKRAIGKTSPNPMVGAVLVKDGKIIAQDYHKKAGTPHAEALVLSKAVNNAKGADLYVTLEPCCHLNKRTPPCTRAIINAGIKRVFVAMKDPNPLVSGGGIEGLKKAGIEVYTGILEEEATLLNEAYIKYITTATPFVTIKMAMTLDGKIATSTGESKWITGEASRKEVHKMRSSIDAILSAKGTVLKDNPQFTARLRGGKNPIRVIIDPALEIPIDYNIFNNEAKTIVFYSKDRLKDDSKLDEIAHKGHEAIGYETSPIALKNILKELGKRAITSVMIEGGSDLNSRALLEGVVDKVVVFIAPKIMCGKNSKPVTGGDVSLPLDKALRLKRVSVRRFEDDIMLVGYLI